MSVAFSSALYYPYIDIENERWLRSAVLYWDSIRTIVPASFQDPYSSKFARALFDEGILEPLRVSSDMVEVEDLTDKVLDYLTDPATSDVILGTDEKRTRQVDPDEASRKLQRLVRIHPQKLPYTIRPELERVLNDDGWLEVDPGFANYYMTLLATQMAERLGLGLVTESSTADQLAITVRKGIPPSASKIRQSNRHNDALGPRRYLPTDVASGLLIDLMMQGISLPEHLSVKDILNFKRDHKDELAVLRQEVARLTTDLPKDVPVEAIKRAVLDQYNAKVLPAVHSLQQSTRAQGWNAVFDGLLKVSFFSVAPASAAIVAGIPSSIALLAGVGISLTASVVQLVYQQRSTRIDNPYSYLLSMEDHW